MYDWRLPGFRRFARAAVGELPALARLANGHPAIRGGARLDRGALSGLLAPGGAIAAVAADVLPGAFPVRAILFDKSADANWALGWHQDRVVTVRHRRETAGFTAWTRKQGLLHASPPIAVLAGMVTLRVHLDPVDEDNAPLLVSPGSHRCGRVAEAEIAAVVDAHGTHACLAEAGDVYAYATPILHASDRARRPRQRRVLQVDFAAAALPNGLEWMRL